jgi:predicted nucleic acid-binding protein
MKNFILDASAILTYSLVSNKKTEHKLKPIIQLAEKKKIKFLSSSFFYAEIVNAIRFEVKNPDQAGKILKQIFAIPVTIVQLKTDQYEPVLRLAYQNNTTVYDSLYHFIAISRNATLLTCDKRYYLVAKRLNHIEYLG